MSGPEQWGPHGWKFIHYITLGYPDKPTKEDKNKYKNFFLSLADVIPCILCKNNYIRHLKIYPLTDYVLKTRVNLMAWGIKMHNLVNMENNKKEYSVKDGIKMIKKNDDSCIINIPGKNKFNKFIYLTPMVIFGLILLYQLYKIYNNKFESNLKD
jgi:hypothetical protein